LATSKHSFECLLIYPTWFRGISWMGVQPDSRKLFRLPAEINLTVEKVCHCRIVELDTDTRHFLLDCNELFYEKQIICLGNAETSDLFVRLVPEMQQLRPSSRAEPQCGLSALVSLNSPA
jgi:hypothetical protein